MIFPTPHWLSECEHRSTGWGLTTGRDTEEAKNREQRSGFPSPTEMTALGRARKEEKQTNEEMGNRTPVTVSRNCEPSEGAMTWGPEILEETKVVPEAGMLWAAI